MGPYARVLAEPGSLAARRALAAAWTAQGNAQAALIDKQLAYRDLVVQGAAGAPKAHKLLDEIDALIAKHGRAWAGRVADLVPRYKFRRGLVAQVTVPGDRFLAIAQELFGLAPIQHVDLIAPLGAFDAIVRSPVLRKLASLAADQHKTAFGDREATALARSEHAAGLRWLSLWGNSVTEAGAEALAASPYLEKVVYLGLIDNPCDATPYVLEDQGFRTVDRPMIASELEARYGKRPWLTGPSKDAQWPPDRDELAIT